VEHESTDGPVDVVGLDVYLTDRTAADDLQFVGGYDQTYDAQTSSDTEEFAVFEFKQPEDATRFVQQYLTAYNLTATADPTIAGAQDYDHPVDAQNEATDHGIVVTKGNRAVIVDYYGDPNQPRPAALVTMTQQLARV
jgi:hypothetical protein